MIGQFDLQRLAGEQGWQTVGALPVVDCVLWDSREDLAGTLYVALVGERFDGHDFCEQAKTNGAVALLVEREVDSPLPQIIVPNSLFALGCLAKTCRSRFEGILIAMTGSAGKTTVKTMVSTICQSVANTLATQANFNNEVGVPKTLLQLSDSHRFAVVEMGASKVGDIAYLCDFAKPDIALVTNAAEAHIEGFGSLDGVAIGKGEIFESLEDGVAIINRDSPYFEQWQQRAAGNQVISFGIHPEADIRADNIQLSLASSQFELCSQNQGIAVHLPAPGQHNVLNALAAIACASAAGIDASIAAKALANFSSAPSRMQTVAHTGDFTLIDDSYNANPQAFEKAVDVLSQASGSSYLVMGDMAELDPNRKQELHAAVGKYAKSQGVDHLYAVGQLSKAACEAFNGQHFESKAALAESLLWQLQAGDTVLVKGSRSAKMEEVVKLLAAGKNNNNPLRETSC